MMKYLKLLPLLLISVLTLSTANAQAWKVCRSQWTEQDEKVYSDFVERICDSKYGNLNKFIKDPKVNPLYGEEDKNFNLSPDCADLPYMIRAYVAYKLRLPFSYVSEISGNGGDERYSKGNKAKAFKDQDFFKSPQQLFYQVALVNSGYFRMDASSENSDHYPIKINKKNLTPGTIYYDPDGHVAIVAKVYDNGRIRLIDAHPDKSISKPWFGTKFSKGNKNNGGGFKKWRQIRYTSEGKIVRTQNHNLKDYSATDQYTKTFSINGKSGIDYHEYVRLAMSKGGVRSDPMSEFCYMMQDIYEDIRYRAMAVDVAIQKGCHLKPHPGKLPYNIYGTDGIWEELSTPSRDARLKVAFREFYDTTRQMVLAYEQQDKQMARALAYNFLLKYDELAPKFYITYVNSAGKKVNLNFADINYRLFDLSFDPYHSIEYRWGAKGAELATANDGETKRNLYFQERRLRNQLERLYGCNTPITMGPDKPVSVDIRSWLYNYVQGASVDRQIIAFNKETITKEQAPVTEIVPVLKPEETVTPKPQEQVVAATSNEPINQRIQYAMAQTPVTEVKATITPIPAKEKEIIQSTEDEQELIAMVPAAEKNSQHPLQSSLKAVENSNNSIDNNTRIENKNENFWDSLLSKGDQIAAVIVDTNSYTP